MARSQKVRQLLPVLWHMIRRLSPYLRKQRALIGGSTAAVLAEVIFRLLEPWPLKYIFDRVLDPTQANQPSGIALFDSISKLNLLTLLAVSVLIITALRAVAAYLNTVGFALIGNRVLTDVRGDLYRHLQCLSLSFHTRARGGDLIVRVIGDIGMLKDVAVTAMLPLLGNVLILLGMAAFMLWLNWQLALLVLATVPLFWLSTLKHTRRIHAAVAKQRQRESAMAATAGESIGAIKTVQALALEERFSGTFAGQNKKSLKEGVQASRMTARLERGVDVLAALATALVLWRGAQLVLSGALTAGSLLVFLRYLQTAFRPARDFAKYTSRLAKAAAASERVLEVLNRQPDVMDKPGAADAPPLRGAVRFENVSFRYDPAAPWALEAIDLEIAPGEHVAIVGASGSGKTTLANLLLRLYDPIEGCVMVDGLDLRDVTLKSLRSQIGVVLQDSLLFAASIRENIALGNPDAAPAHIEAAAKVANVHDFIRSLPEGYDTVVGERGVTLSGGQRQRIAIARAAVRDARILILDEPATALDEINATSVLSALEKLAAGRTTVYITHDLSIAARADLVVVLEEGRIVERGTHEQLLALGGRYARSFRLQNAMPPVTAADPPADQMDQTTDQTHALA